LRHVGFELWQVKAGTIFDNILVTDDPAYASKFAQETWGAMKDGEKAMMEDTPEDAAADDEDDDDDADYTHDEL
jgi:calreticulin